MRSARSWIGVLIAIGVVIGCGLLWSQFTKEGAPPLAVFMFAVIGIAVAVTWVNGPPARPPSGKRMSRRP